MDDCIFCKIIKGEIPSTKVYEDEVCYAFKDIEPVAPVHYLFIPKDHIESAAKITSENSHIVAHIYEAIAKVAKEEGFDKDGFRIVNNTGLSAGQTVFHIHFHVIAGRKQEWPAG